MENLHEIIGNNVRRLRKDHDVQQNVLAKELGIANSNLTKIEKGERKLNLEKFLETKRILDTDINELLVGTGYEDSRIEIAVIEEELKELTPEYLLYAKEMIHQLVELQNKVLSDKNKSSSSDTKK